MEYFLKKKPTAHFHNGVNQMQVHHATSHGANTLAFIVPLISRTNDGVQQ